LRRGRLQRLLVRARARSASEPDGRHPATRDRRGAHEALQGQRQRAGSAVAEQPLSPGRGDVRRGQRVPPRRCRRLHQAERPAPAHPATAGRSVDERRLNGIASAGEERDVPATAVLPSEPGAAYAAVRLRNAGVGDAERLAALYAQVRPGPLATAAGMRAWLATGWALFVEDQDGRVLAALSWRAESAGANEVGANEVGANEAGASEAGASGAGASDDGWDEGWRVEAIA